MTMWQSSLHLKKTKPKIPFGANEERLKKCVASIANVKDYKLRLTYQGLKVLCLCRILKHFHASSVGLTTTVTVSLLDSETAATDPECCLANMKNVDHIAL